MRFQLFPSLIESPRKIRFDKQEKEETIILFLRQHPIVNFFWITTAIFLTVMPGFLVLLEGYLGFNFAATIPVNLLIGGLIIYYLIVAAYVFEQFLSWYFNVYIVTNMHVVDINFYSLLSKEVVEISLDEIQVISHKVSGILGSLFHFGMVDIETAAAMKRITFDKVPRPDMVTDTVQNLQRARRIGRYKN